MITARPLTARRIIAERIRGLLLGETGALFSPLNLFRNGEEGFYNDIQTYSSTYYEDTAGSDAAELEDTIALILDQSGNEINLTQATAGARPKLSARYNLLTYSEDFASGDNSGVSFASATNPFGATNDCKVILDSGIASSTSSDRAANRATRTTAEPNNTYTISVFAKQNELDSISLLAFAANNAGRYAYTQFNLFDGTLDTSVEDSGGGWFSNVVASMQNIGNGWYKCSMTFFIGPNVTFARTYWSVSNSTAVTGDGVKSVFIFGADFRLASDTDQPAYQRVTTATDYDTLGFDPYLQFDLVDDALTATIPAITGGTLVLATRDGIWIDDDINASAGTFSVGPTTYTGGPAGLLSVIGNKLIGPPLLLDRQLTASEKNAVVQWFRSRGAGALYVLGEELVVNGTFDSADDWTLGAGWSIGSGVLTGSAAVSPSNASQAYATDQFAAYLSVFTISDLTAGSVRFQTNNKVLTTRTANGVYSEAFVQPFATQTQIRFQAVSDFSGSVDNASLRKITQPGA